MTSEIKYYDSNYNYISPVRHFKANDPYYYEVDNIPIKQLEEGKNFLKDQVDGILRDRANFKVSIDRSGFSELQPFVTGSDRKIRVRAGRYTARVNDAYSITPLQFITQIAGFSNTNEFGSISDLNTYEIQTTVGEGVAEALSIFQSGLNGVALNMNGLAERTFTYPIANHSATTPAGSTDFLNAKTIADYISKRTNNTQITAPLLPNVIGQMYSDLGETAIETYKTIRNILTVGATPDASQQNRLESAFIKRWRGAIRTSIVDVSGELSVSVPEFDDNDFFYIDEEGNNQSITATQRIDLVFIYSKAIDQTQTHLADRDAGNGTRIITKPTLGILKGAGIGVSRDSQRGEVDLTDLDGVPIMLAHPGDELGNNTGFETSSAGVIRGSFPSPDDLLNLAPVLSEGLETDSMPLIGQSILPVAYIRVNNAGGTADILGDTDVIDIRPFFRTTELAYNERAGIAAATPQLSIANPVATEAALEKTRKEVFGTLDSKIDNLFIPNESPSRVVAMGTVCGGMRYGPEGALFRQANATIDQVEIQNVNWNELADAAETFFGYLPGSITFEPAWDPAPWSLTKTPNPGQRGADYIHVCWPMAAESTNARRNTLPPWNRSVNMNNLDTPGLIASEGTLNDAGMQSFGIKQPYPDEVNGLQGGDFKYRGQNVVLHYCRKTIKINRDLVPWLVDYSVNAELLNCIPLSAKADGGSKRQGHAAGASNIWINKQRDYFTINVAWVANDFNALADPNNFAPEEGQGIPWANRNQLEDLAAFALPEIPIPEPGNFTQFNVQTRNMPGGPQSQGSNVINRVNSNITPGTGLANKVTSVNFFTNVTPVLYPSVSYEIIGHSNTLVSRSPRGSAMTGGATPTIELA